MTSLPGIVITGASGRMGQMLIETVRASDKCQLVAVTERAGHDWVGQDLGAAMGGPEMGVPVLDDAAAAMSGAQALIDFTSPAATVAHAKLAAEAGVAHIIGTTGMTEEDITKIDGCGDKTVIVRAGNMSLGVSAQKVKAQARPSCRRRPPPCLAPKVQPSKRPAQKAHGPLPNGAAQSAPHPPRRSHHVRPQCPRLEWR